MFQTTNQFFVENMITVTDSPVDLMLFDELYRHKKRKLLKFAPPPSRSNLFCSLVDQKPREGTT